ncbi:hypothetical protein SeMB42_g01987 [Synchytrium endobioticum]|uniref:Myb-like domain-containing protein n=1 Tax=Synchytrium endobioticum TaxID=286115 RepID=A0A507CVJ6_9FUNG|nr:hypothetical protein SeLEV6574_g05216 [Synchytrium endobioticum]TPX51214.1 hypothetical protein SeMB42_g01987 [Synchytrium endobioticum]
MQQVTEDHVNKIVIRKKIRPAALEPGATAASPANSNQPRSAVSSPSRALFTDLPTANGTSASKSQHQPAISPASPPCPASQNTTIQASNKRAPDDVIFKLPAVKKPRQNDQPKDVLTMLNSTYKGAAWILVSLDDLIQGEEIEEERGGLPQEGEYPRIPPPPSNNNRTASSKIQFPQHLLKPRAGLSPCDSNLTRENTRDSNLQRDYRDSSRNDDAHVSQNTQQPPPTLGSRSSSPPLHPRQLSDQFNEFPAPIILDPPHKVPSPLLILAPTPSQSQTAVINLGQRPCSTSSNNMSIPTTQSLPSSLRSAPPASSMSPTTASTHLAATLGLPAAQRPLYKPTTSYHSKIQPSQWSFLDDARLLASLRSLGVPTSSSSSGLTWNDIANQVGNRSGAACQFRFYGWMNGRLEPH